MVGTKTEPTLGMGLYTPREAAYFAKLRTETFNRWFYGDARGNAVLNPRIGTFEDERVVTFWDLIQAVGVRQLRASPKANRVKLDHIRKVVRQCNEKDIAFPLARRHTLYWYSNRLILKTEKNDYIGLESGLDLDQLYHAEIIRPYLKEIKFDENRLATSWTPLKSDTFRVVLDSRRRLGMPIIEPKGILVSALADAVESEGSIEAAADAFETDPEAVMLALKYDEYLSSAA